MEKIFEEVLNSVVRDSEGCLLHFKCRFCNKTIKRNDNFKLHLSKLHYSQLDIPRPAKNIICEFENCEFRFFTKAEMNSHVKKKHLVIKPSMVKKTVQKSRQPIVTTQTAAKRKMVILPKNSVKLIPIDSNDGKIRVKIVAESTSLVASTLSNIQPVIMTTRKRNLLVDEVNEISGEEMKVSTPDLVHTAAIVDDQSLDLPSNVDSLETGRKTESACSILTVFDQLEESNDKIETDFEHVNNSNLDTEGSDSLNLDASDKIEESTHPIGKSIALLTIDASAIESEMETERKRNLPVDEVNEISGEEMKNQLTNVSDIIRTLDLAAPTKQFMHWEETGVVEKLFTLPSRYIPARELLQNYQRNLISRSEGIEREKTQVIYMLLMNISTA